jgi:hypothetical protein
MKCRQAQELMGAYLYGDLAPEEMRDLRTHAQDCVLCREDLATRGRVVSSLDDSPPTLSDDDRQRIAWSVKGAIRKQQTRSRPLALRLAPTFALAAAVLAAGFLAGKITNRPPQQTASAAKGQVRPGPKVEIKEVPNESKTGKSADQFVEFLRTISPTATASGTSRNTASGRGQSITRKSIDPQSDTVKVNEPRALPDNSAAAPKDSGTKPKNTETGTTSGDTKLPRVTDPKNAETTPSESQ